MFLLWLWAQCLWRRPTCSKTLTPQLRTGGPGADSDRLPADRPFQYFLLKDLFKVVFRMFCQVQEGNNCRFSSRLGRYPQSDDPPVGGRRIWRLRPGRKAPDLIDLIWRLWPGRKVVGVIFHSTKLLCFWLPGGARARSALFLWTWQNM